MWAKAEVDKVLASAHSEHMVANKAVAEAAPVEGVMDGAVGEQGVANRRDRAGRDSWSAR